jgi:transketolase
MAIAYSAANVKIVGFMPVLDPWRPEPSGHRRHRADARLPNMTVIDLADATEIAQAPAIAANHPGPMYLRLKRGEIPLICADGHRLNLKRAQVLTAGDDVTMVASGMMVPSALAAERFLSNHGVTPTVVNSPVIKPLDAVTIVSAARRSRVVLTAENRTFVVSWPSRTSGRRCQ